MGAIHVTVTVRNPADRERSWEGVFLVDTGATDSLVPRQHLEAIGLEPRGDRVYELADGSEVRLDVGGADIEFMGEYVATTVVFGDNGAEPLLGVTALESVGIEVDPRNQQLKRLPAVRLKHHGKVVHRGERLIGNRAPAARLKHHGKGFGDIVARDAAALPR